MGSLQLILTQTYIRGPLSGKRSEGMDRIGVDLLPTYPPLVCTCIW